MTSVFTNMKVQLLLQRIQTNQQPCSKEKGQCKSCAMHYPKVCLHCNRERVAKGYKGQDQCQRAVVFSSKVEYVKIPATGEQHKVVRRLPQTYDKHYPTSESVPKPDKLVAHRAKVIARQLQEVIKLFNCDPQPKCRFRCNDEEGGTTH